MGRGIVLYRILPFPILYIYIAMQGGRGDTIYCAMNMATIRFFTPPLKRFLDRVSLAHLVICVIRLPVTVEFS